MNIYLIMEFILCFIQNQPFQEYLEVYLGLGQYISTETGTNKARKLNLPMEAQCRRLHCTLRDLSSLLQALGRLVEHFIAENFHDRMADAVMLVEK